MDEIILGAEGVLMKGDGKPVADPLRALGARVVLAPGFTLRGFMRMLKANPVLLRLSEFAPEFSSQYDTWPEAHCWPAGLETLEFARVVELVGHPGPARLEIYHTLRGRIAGGEDVEIKGWRVEMLLDVPLVLGQLRHVVFGDRVEEFHFRTVCNLFDFYEGVLWQLAFHGTPLECALRR